MNALFRKAKLLLPMLRTYRNVPTWAWNWLGGFPKHAVLLMRLRNGLQFECLADEARAIDDVFMRHEYQTARNAIGEGAVVVDVGANIGAFSLFAATRAPGVRVYACEMFPATASRLSRNVALNRLERNVLVVPKGIMGKAGEYPAYVSPAGSGANTIAPYRDNLDFVKQGQAETVSAVTLDQVFEEHKIARCDFLKMDCEGAEFEIIRSVSDELLRKVRHLAMEYHRDPAELVRRLRAAGFAVETRPTDATSGFLFADR